MFARSYSSFRNGCDLMQTDFLEYLLDLQETKSLSQTAENFYVSHQSVRAGIKNLEQLFGVQLIQCTNKGCILTLAGEMVAEYAVQIFRQKRELEEKLRPYINDVMSNTNKKTKKHLTVYILSSIANKKILNFLTDYKNTHNKIDMDIQIVKLESLMASDTLKIDSSSVILTNYTTMTGANLYKQFDLLEERYQLGRIEIAKVPLWFVVGKKSPWAKYDLITGKEMPEIPMFSIDYNPQMMEIENLKNRHIVNGFSERAELVKNNLGGAIFNEIEFQAVFSNEKSVKKIPVNINGHTSISFIGLTNGAEGFSEELTEFLKAFCSIF